MKVISFLEQNVVFAENQPEYIPLPAYKFKNDREGRIVCCWKLTWRERFQVLLTGIMWHQVLTFGGKLQPQLISAEKPDMAMGDYDCSPISGLSNKEAK